MKPSRLSTVASRTRGLRRIVLAAALGVAVLGATGCASTAVPSDDPYALANARKDPFESYNRKMHAFNKGLDDYVLAPTARAYKSYVPYVLRYAASSFFSNLEDVWIGANNLMQGKPGRAINDWTRVLLNSTFGFFGVSDPATEMGFPKSAEDFGQTLGVWGVPSGPYLVLPFFGPSSVRDTGGFAVDWFADPLTEVVTVTEGQWGARAARIVDDRAKLLDASNLMQGIALDEYSFLRDAYLQSRRNEVYDGDPPLEDESSPYGDDPYKDESSPYADDPYKDEQREAAESAPGTKSGD